MCRLISHDHTRELQELGSQDMLVSAVISVKEQGLKRSGSFTNEPLELSCSHVSLLRDVQILGYKKKLSPRQYFRYTVNLLELNFLLSQQCFSMTSRE